MPKKLAPGIFGLILIAGQNSLAQGQLSSQRQEDLEHFGSETTAGPRPSARAAAGWNGFRRIFLNLGHVAGR
jgi:hypothetical protein